MAGKAKKLEELLTLKWKAVKVVSYVDYFAQRPLFSSLQIKNNGEEGITDLVLSIKNDGGMLIPCEKNLNEIPYESTVEVELGNILSPLYFASAEEVKEEKIEIVLCKDKKIITKAEVTVTTLPFDFWEGTEGNEEELATFVRPRLGDCVRMQSEIAAQLKKWEVPCEFGGYVGNDKNTVRRIIAALYASIRRFAIQRKEADISQPVEAGAGVKILAERKASPLELALFVCGCLENLGLHPLLVFGEREITCGVWLYESCFIDTVSDDVARLEA